MRRALAVLGSFAFVVAALPSAPSAAAVKGSVTCSGNGQSTYILGLSNQVARPQRAVFRGTMTSCTTGTGGNFRMNLARAAAVTCDAVENGTGASFPAVMTLRWSATSTSSAPGHVTYTGQNVAHFDGFVAYGAYKGDSVATDLVLTPVPNPTLPAPSCTDRNRLQHFSFTFASLSLQQTTLASLTVAPLSLQPAFSPSTYDYVVQCSTGTNSLTIDATAQVSGSVKLVQPTTTTAAPALDSVVGLAENDAAVVRAIDKYGHSADYWIRCLPHDFPPITVTYPNPGGPTPGWYVIGDNITAGKGSFAMILDGNGTPVWYRRGNPGAAVNVTPIGHDSVAFYELFGGSGFGIVPDGTYDVFNLDDNTTSTIKTVGTPTDLHELQTLPNGDHLMLSYPLKTGVDLTELVGNPTPGPNSTIADCVAQEVDPLGNVVWQWRASDHVDPVTETTISPVPAPIVNGTNAFDVFHCNSLEVGPDGNILLSMRHANALFEIRKSDGQVLWKLGGTPTNKDGATLIHVANDPEGGFAQQHDARWMPNGDISLFDNQSAQTGRSARAIEYSVNFTTDTAQPVFSYLAPTNQPGCCMGDFRHFADGHMIIGWGLLNAGLSQPIFTELDAGGHAVLEVSMGAGRATYRAIKVPYSMFDQSVLRQTARH